MTIITINDVALAEVARPIVIIIFGFILIFLALSIIDLTINYSATASL